MVARKLQRRGLTLIELLLSLTITAMLMAAIGTSVNGALTSYSENAKISDATQSLRSTLGRITREIRRANAIACYSSSISIIPIPDGSGVTLIQFERGDDGKLYYRSTDGSGTQSYVLIGDGKVAVDTFELTSEMAPDNLGVYYTTRVTIHLQVIIDNKLHAVTASACPRRNQLY